MSFVVKKKSRQKQCKMSLSKMLSLDYVTLLNNAQSRARAHWLLSPMRVTNDWTIALSAYNVHIYCWYLLSTAAICWRSKFRFRYQLTHYWFKKPPHGTQTNKTIPKVIIMRVSTSLRRRRHESELVTRYTMNCYGETDDFTKLLFLHRVYPKFHFQYVVTRHYLYKKRVDFIILICFDKKSCLLFVVVIPIRL